MSRYPIMLYLEGRTVVVVGGGNVATRKVEDLLITNARIVVIALFPSPLLQSLAIEKRITLYTEAYQSGMLKAIAPLLVFAATDSPEVNQQVMEEARAVGALVNTADNALQSDFHNMATVQRGDITISISTGGASPALTSHLRDEVERVIGEEVAVLARWMGELRPRIQAKLPEQKARGDFWRQIIASPILRLLQEGDRAGARQVLDEMVAKLDLQEREQ